EKDGFLRVATTTNWETRWWLAANERPQTENNVYVLTAIAGKLRKIGALTDISPGERIFSARFVGDRGFLVTFQQLDPMTTIDLSDPSAPPAVGQHTTPGVATYLQPIAGDRLLSIGYGGDANGLNWRTQLGLYDVSNFAAPALDATFDLSTDATWVYSQA